MKGCILARLLIVNLFLPGSLFHFCCCFLKKGVVVFYQQYMSVVFPPPPPPPPPQMLPTWCMECSEMCVTFSYNNTSLISVGVSGDWRPGPACSGFLLVV